MAVSAQCPRCGGESSLVGRILSNQESGTQAKQVFACEACQQTWNREPASQETA